MTDLDMALSDLLGLAQLALAVIAVDAVLANFLDFSFLTGVIRQIAYAGGAIGLIDHVVWLLTERIPKLLDM
jgi:hypothetical protein